MSFENVTLWFAKNEMNEIVTISEITDKNRNRKYFCPMCGSELVPRAIKSKQVTEHFAHIDASKCNSETMIHWWFKNKFLEQGDCFIVVSDNERKYTCKEVLVEQVYKGENKAYKPDVTVVTECGKTIYFEMDYSNKKKLRDYIDIWIELKNIVVEVDIKKLMNKDKIPIFKALFYNGKCYNTKKNDLYYNTIGKYKEEKLLSDIDINIKERLQKLDWFWSDILRYKNREVSIEYMIDLIDCIDEEDREIIEEILHKPKCIDLFKEYLDKKVEKVYKLVSDIAKTYFGDSYTQYIKKEISYCNFTKRYTGKIGFLDMKDNCFCVYNIFDYDTVEFTELSISKFKKMIDYIKEKELESEWRNITCNIIDSINLNQDMIDYYTNLKNKNYKLSIWFDYRDKTKYILKSNLCYLKTDVVADSFEIEVETQTDTSEIVCNIIENYNSYFTNLMKIKNIEDLVYITQYLNNKYKGIVDVNGELWLEDIYEISISNISNTYFSECYYISNTGILKNCRINEIKLLTNKRNTIKSYLITDINYKLQKAIEKKCINCGEKFSLELDEIKFYNSKGFNYPKRCKSCRKQK